MGPGTGTGTASASTWQGERGLCCAQNLCGFGRAPCAQAQCRGAWQTPASTAEVMGASGFSWKATFSDGWSGIVSYILARACHRPLRFVIVSKKKIVQELGNDVR